MNDGDFLFPNTERLILSISEVGHFWWPRIKQRRVFAWVWDVSDFDMRFLIVNNDYPKYIQHFYAQHPGLESRSYEEQLKARMESLFGLADFYSSNLKKLGHEAWNILANHEPLQFAWAREHGIEATKSFPLRLVLRRGYVPWLKRVEDRRWFYEILMAQVRNYKPDILFNQTMGGIPNDFIHEIKPYVKLVVGQHAAPLPSEGCYDAYDLVISSLPNIADYFKSTGIPSEVCKLGFEPRVAKELKSEDKTIPVSFVGSLFPVHEARMHLLECICQRVDIQIWGHGVEWLPGNSPIHKNYMGEAWGFQMYQILRNSSITLNHHIDIAGPYANNMRLYETTGVGTLLITDWKKNLHEIFGIGKEVVAYRSTEECFELIQYYLEHDEEREAIARAGQQRTLREHTYYQRMQELVDIIQKYL